MRERGELGLSAKIIGEEEESGCERPDSRLRLASLRLGLPLTCCCKERSEAAAAVATLRAAEAAVLPGLSFLSPLSVVSSSVRRRGGWGKTRLLSDRTGARAAADRLPILLSPTRARFFPFLLLLVD